VGLQQIFIMGQMFNYGGDIFEAIAAFTTRIISVEYHKKSLAVFPVRRRADRPAPDLCCADDLDYMACIHNPA
jgi:hypothetical protein